MKAISKYTFEEIEVNMEFSISRTISNQQIKAFSSLTGDYHPLHADKNYAKEHAFNDVIAHGMLISSFSSALVGMHLPGETMILISQSFDYLKPVYPNDSIEIKGVVKRKMKPLKMVFLEVIIKSEDEVVAQGVIKLKMRK